jgi:hypothetical protein
VGEDGENLGLQRVRVALAYGTYSRCPACSADNPADGVLPDGWSIAIRKVKLPGQAEPRIIYTTHRKGCPSAR